MGFLRQTSTLIGKDLKIVGQRRWLSTSLRAWIMPVLYMLFIAYVKNFFLPPSHYGIGEPRLTRDLTTEVFNSSLTLGGRHKVAFVRNGFTGGEIESLIQTLTNSLESVGADVQILDHDDDLLSVCQSSLSGRSSCYAAASFHSSPTEGPSGHWSYTARVDAGLGLSVHVDSANNAAQIYVLPFLQAIDGEIARLSGSQLPTQILEQPFTYETIQDRNNEVQQVYTGALANYLAVTLFIALCGITFHLPGYLAVERQSGLSSLIDVMSNSSPLTTIIARLASAFVSFATIYSLAWICVGAIVASVVFPSTSPAIIIPFHILFGLSLTAYSLFLGSFFRKAQLSGVTALILSLVLAVVAQFVPRNPVAVAVLSAIFPPSTYTLFSIQLAQWEHQLLPANISTSPPNTSYSGIPGYLSFIFVGAQILIYSVLAVLVQWTLHRTSGSHSKRSRLPLNPHISVRLVNVSKTFPGGVLSGTDNVQAVNGLTLSIPRGQLVSLLGINGSGKSTLLACLTGTLSFSSGEVGVAPDQTIGLCPQQNVAWDDLTILENTHVFSRLESTITVSQDQLRDLLVRCDIADKERSRPSTLSGGQKRKLQLALAFAGNSTLCCIDEASSGLDPLSRRKIWDILLAERGRRTIIFTTHALDEADALADHIAVMSLGQLIAEGSSAGLKDRFGSGYHVDVRTSERLPYVVAGAHRTTDGDQHTYAVSDSTQACAVINELEQRVGDLDVSVRGPTIEDVFLNIASPSGDLSHETVFTKYHLSRHEDGRRSQIMAEKFALHDQPGKGSGFWKQVFLLHWKRWKVARRNFMPYICALAIPIITAGVAGYFFLHGFNGIPCTQGAISTRPYTLTLPGLEACCGIKIPVGPLNRLPRSALPAGYEQYRRYIRTVDSYDGFQSYIQNHFRTIDPGGYYVGAEAEGVTAPLMAYRINGGLGYAALAKNLADQYLSNTRIVADFSTFALPISGAAGDSLQFILYISLALCAFPAFLALYPTYERLRNVRALHYSCGVRPAPLWLGYALFDGLIVLVTSIVVIIILTAISNVWYAPAYLCIVFILYGLCSMLVAYIVSLFSKTLLSAFAFVAGFQAVSMTLYFVIYLLLLTFGSQERLEGDLTIIQFTYGFLSPAASLFRAMLLTLNQSQLVCRNHSLITYPANIEVYGGPYLCLTLQIIAGFAFLVKYDAGQLPKIRTPWRKRSDDRDAEKVFGQAEDSVTREEQHAEVSNDALRVLHVSRRFGRGKKAVTAVEDATFGVPRGGVMALLGPNGAGKTTTMSVIRGDLKPSEKDSDVLISGHSVVSDRLHARNQLGVCPQFNSSDLMTVKQHLHFYARIRGVSDVSSRVDSTMRAVGLSPFRKRLTAQLSGGNQRKLHLATAIIGNPGVCILDEPSSGMDAIAMRSMWKAIKDVSEERAVVITTHSMEEAATLANKVVMMDKRILTVGSPSELRERYGKDVYQIHVAHPSGSMASMQDMQNIRDWILQRCEEVEAGTPSSIMHGQLRLHVLLRKRSDVDGSGQSNEIHGYYGQKQAASPLRELLEALEQCKQAYGVEYSISPMTLEDVFLRIVRRPEDITPFGG